MDRLDLVARLLMVSNDVRVRSDPDLADAARTVECLALTILREREREILDPLYRLALEREAGRTV